MDLRFCAEIAKVQFKFNLEVFYMSLSFVHLSDLHLGYTRWPNWHKREAPSCDNVKSKYLAEISKFIRTNKPDALIMAGDVTECHSATACKYVLPYV